MIGYMAQNNKNTLLITKKEALPFFDNLMSILEVETSKYTIPVVSLVEIHYNDPFAILVSTLLSLRTKDETTALAFKKLYKVAKKPEDILNIDDKKLEELIYPVGFYKTKAKRLKQICKILIEKYNGEVPDTMEKLLELPGVGRKTANLVLAVGFKKEGMCVDTHVHRISNRLGIIKTKNPFETEMALRQILPTKYWEKYNQYLVAWGQNVCKPISPFCSKCKINKFCKRVGVTKSR